MESAIPDMIITTSLRAPRSTTLLTSSGAGDPEKRDRRYSEPAPPSLRPGGGGQPRAAETVLREGALRRGARGHARETFRF